MHRNDSDATLDRIQVNDSSESISVDIIQIPELTFQKKYLFPISQQLPLLSSLSN